MMLHWSNGRRAIWSSSTGFLHRPLWTSAYVAVRWRVCICAAADVCMLTIGSAIVAGPTLHDCISRAA